MTQDIYFPRWTSLEQIQATHALSSWLLFGWVIIFSIIFLVALVSLVKVVTKIRQAHTEQKNVMMNMQLFYKDQLKILQWKQFFITLYQYVRFLGEIRRTKDTSFIWYELWYNRDDIVSIEKVALMWNDVESEQENRIKEILSRHLSSN